jgi:DNA-binding transcriptional LysR family regulator
MTTAIAPTDVDRLGKLLRLALVADKDGETVAAVAALKRSLQSVGLDPHFIADAFERGAAPLARADDRADRRDDGDGDDDRSAIWFAWHRRYRLSAKERAFIENIVRWSAPLSPRQRQWLFNIVGRLEGG